MSFQVISRDEYGQTAILGTHNDIKEALKHIRKEVSNLNFENALTTDNKFASIDAYAVDFFDSAGLLRDDLVYAGNSTNGSHRAINPGNGDEHDASKSNPRIYIGSNEGEEFYLEDHKHERVVKLDHDLLTGKTYFFVKRI